MAVTLKALIKAAPFPEDHKKVLLEKFDQLTEDEKRDLSNVAWYSLAVMYNEKLRIERQYLFDQVAEGTKNINPNDYQEIEAKLTYEFAQMLEAAESEESIAEVRQQLEKYKSKPLPQDKKLAN